MAKARGGSVGEIRHSWRLSRALACLLSRRDSLRLRGGYTIPGLSYRIPHDTDRGANFFGRPTLTRAARIAAKGRRTSPSTRRLVLSCLLPSRPQERFRTWPRLTSLGDLENPDIH